MSNIWREWREDYSSPERESEMLKAIRASNLPEEFKPAVLAKMAHFDSFKDEQDNYVRETILKALTAAGRPMRVSELTHDEDAPLHNHTVQKVTAQMRFLHSMSLVNRMEIKSGKTIEVAPGKFVEETAAFYWIGA